MEGPREEHLHAWHGELYGGSSVGNVALWGMQSMAEVGQNLRYLVEI